MARNPIACAAASMALAAAISFLPAATVRAASPICSEISAGLASLTPEPDAGDDARYDRAIEVQLNQLKRADAEKRRLGCGFSVSGSAVERCASLARQSEEMQANLADLRRQANAGSGSASAERSRLLRLSAANGCSDETARPIVEGLRGVEAAAGVRVIRGDGADEFALAEPSIGDPNHIVLEPQLRGMDQNGSYRTMCVRTCDGYYFPISYAVTPAHFAADRQACERRCPGTDVKLYVHRVPEEDAERMISVSDGTPYTALPRAFLYREPERRPSGICTCQETAGGYYDFGGTAQRGFQILSPSGEGVAPKVDGSIVTIPAPAASELPAEAVLRPTTPAPIAAEPPETTGPEPEPQIAAKPVEEDAVEDERVPAGHEPVRVIGPKFFPDPSKAEVLRAPGPTPGR